MATTKWLSLAALIVSASAAVGCGGDDGAKTQKCPAGVVANQTVPGCACGADAATGTGVQTCQMDGNLSDCVCGTGGAGVSGGAAGTNGAAGSSVNTGGTSGGSGVGGSDDDGGVPSGEAGSGGGAGASGSGGGTVKQPAHDGTVLSTCDPNADMPCGADLGCYTASSTTVGFCTPACTKDDDCKSVGDGFTCATTGEKLCRRTCDSVDDKTCPEYMSCTAVPGGYRCLYDEKDVGTASKKIWEKCDGTGDCQGDLVCYGNGLVTGAGIGGMSYQGFCTQPCAGNDDCTEKPKSGDVEPTCDTFNGWCRLDCAPGIGNTSPECPKDMDCATVSGVGPLPGGTMRCAYPTTSSGGI